MVTSLSCLVIALVGFAGMAVVQLQAAVEWLRHEVLVAVAAVAFVTIPGAL